MAQVKSSLNGFAALPWELRKEVRARLQQDLRSGNIPAPSVIELKDVNPHLPFKIGGFSDFYTSLDHCKNVP
jgi:fumarylacetoacetase